MVAGSEESICSVVRLGILGLRSDCSTVIEAERNPLYIDAEWERPGPGCL